MIRPLITLEERLLNGYRAQLSRYDDAAEILAKAGSPDDNHWAHALHARLQEATAGNAAMTEDIAAWRESGQPPMGELKDVLARLAQRIHSLSEGIDRRIREYQAGQLGLVAEMDDFIQQRRMLHAYINRG